MSETMPDQNLPALPTNPDPEPPPTVVPAATAPATAPPAPAGDGLATRPTTAAPGVAPAEPPPPPASTVVIDLPEWLREAAGDAGEGLPTRSTTAAPAAAPVVAPAAAPVVSALAQELALEMMGPPDEGASEEQRAALAAATGTLASKLQQLVRQEANERAISVYDERVSQVRQTMEVQSRALGAQQSFRTNLYASLPAYAGFKDSYVEREIIAPEAVAELRRHGIQDDAGLAALDKPTFEAISRNIITRIAFRFGSNAESLAEHAAWVAANPGAVPAAAAPAGAGDGLPIRPTTAAPVTTVPVGGSAGTVPAPPRVAATGGFVPVGGVAPRAAPLDAEGQVTAGLRSYMGETEGV